MSRSHHARRFALALITVGLFAVTAAAADPTRLRTRLTQNTSVNSVVPLGRARYGANDAGKARLAVGVAKVKLPAGTRLEVTACGRRVGGISLTPGRRGRLKHGRLILSTRKGDRVPTCAAGDRVSVEGSGVDLGGTFQGS